MNRPPPAMEPMLEGDAMEWEFFWQHHRKKIIVGALAFIGIVGGSTAWYVSGVLTNRAAEEALAHADGLEGYRAVVKDFPRSNPAADALLLVAADQRNAGNMEESTAAFRKFLDIHPGHPLAGAALLGIGQNSDASGDAKAAVTSYREVLVRYPGSYVAPFALYSEAEILLRDFRRDEAARALNSILAQFPDSPVARMASDQLARLETSGNPAVP